MTPLHVFGDMIRAALLLVPLGAVRALFVLLLLALMTWVILLPSSEVKPKDRRPAPGENLKVWAVIALAIQVIVYSVL